MPAMEICCLANSRKHGGKCIAGINLVTGQWVRPVAEAGDGRLSYLQTLLEHSGREPQVLDFIRVPLARNARRSISRKICCSLPGRWQLVHRPQTREEFHARYLTLHPYLAEEPLLFGSAEDRVPVSQLRHHTRALFAAAHSAGIGLLANRPSPRAATGKRARSSATSDSTYALAVTDPLWEAALQSLPPGIYPRHTAGITPRHVVWFTVSLGEPMPETGHVLQTGGHGDRVAAAKISVKFLLVQV